MCGGESAVLCKAVHALNQQCTLAHAPIGLQGKHDSVRPSIKKRAAAEATLRVGERLFACERVCMWPCKSAADGFSVLGGEALA